MPLFSSDFSQGPTSERIGLPEASRSTFVDPPAAEAAPLRRSCPAPSATQTTAWPFLSMSLVRWAMRPPVFFFFFGFQVTIVLKKKMFEKT